AALLRKKYLRGVVKLSSAIGYYALAGLGGKKEHAYLGVGTTSISGCATLLRSDCPEIRASRAPAVRSRLRPGCLMPRQGAQGHRLNQGSAPQEGVRRTAALRTGLAGRGDALINPTKLVLVFSFRVAGGGRACARPVPIGMRKSARFRPAMRGDPSR